MTNKDGLNIAVQGLLAIIHDIVLTPKDNIKATLAIAEEFRKFGESYCPNLEVSFPEVCMAAAKLIISEATETEYDHVVMAIRRVLRPDAEEKEELERLFGNVITLPIYRSPETIGIRVKTEEQMIADDNDDEEPII